MSNGITLLTLKKTSFSTNDRMRLVWEDIIRYLRHR